MVTPCASLQRERSTAGGMVSRVWVCEGCVYERVRRCGCERVRDVGVHVALRITHSNPQLRGYQEGCVGVLGCECGCGWGG